MNATAIGHRSFQFSLHLVISFSLSIPMLTGCASDANSKTVRLSVSDRVISSELNSSNQPVVCLKHVSEVQFDNTGKSALRVALEKICADFQSHAITGSEYTASLQAARYFAVAAIATHFLAQHDPILAFKLTELTRAQPGWRLLCSKIVQQGNEENTILKFCNRLITATLVSN